MASQFQLMQPDAVWAQHGHNHKAQASPETPEVYGADDRGRTDTSISSLGPKSSEDMRRCEVT